MADLSHPSRALTSPDDPLVGRVFGDVYRVVRRLGRGAMGVVYEAEHLRLGRRVALKLLNEELAGDAAFRYRFIRESRSAAELDHPNVISVYDAGECEGRLFLAMRFVEGTDLRLLLGRRGALSPGEVLTLVGQLGGALDAAHRAGLVHRDVKPANVLVADGCVYLSDFGLAKRSESDRVMTRTGVFVGTMDYAPPEQIRGDELDGRADVYALACTAWECLVGRAPYVGDSDVRVMYGHLLEPVPRLSRARAGLPAGWDREFEQALAKLPEGRPASGGELARALAAAAPGVRPEPVAETASDVDESDDAAPAPRMNRRRIAAFAVAGLLAAAAGVAGGIVAFGRDDGPRTFSTDVVRLDVPASWSVHPHDGLTVLGQADVLDGRGRFDAGAVAAASDDDSEGVVVPAGLVPGDTAVAIGEEALRRLGAAPDEASVAADAAIGGWEGVRIRGTAPSLRVVVYAAPITEKSGVALAFFGPPADEAGVEARAARVVSALDVQDERLPFPTLPQAQLISFLPRDMTCDSEQPWPEDATGAIVCRSGGLVARFATFADDDPARTLYRGESHAQVAGGIPTGEGGIPCERSLGTEAEYTFTVGPANVQGRLACYVTPRGAVFGWTLVRRPYTYAEAYIEDEPDVRAGRRALFDFWDRWRERAGRRLLGL